MLYVTIIFIVLFAILTVMLILDLIKISKIDSPPKSFIIRETQLTKVTSLILSITIFLVWKSLSGELNTVQNVIVILSILGFILLSYIVIRKEIIVNRDHLILIPIFGKKRRIDFKDITKIEQVHYTSYGHDWYYVYKKDKYSFRIESDLRGADLFVSKMRQNKVNYEIITSGNHKNIQKNQK